MSNIRLFKNGVERAVVVSLTRSGGNDQISYVLGEPVVVGKTPVVWHLVFDRLFLRDTRDLLTAVYELRHGSSTITIKFLSSWLKDGICGANVIPISRQLSPRLAGHAETV